MCTDRDDKVMNSWRYQNRKTTEIEKKNEINKRDSWLAVDRQHILAYRMPMGTDEKGRHKCHPFHLSSS